MKLAILALAALTLAACASLTEDQAIEMTDGD